ncbi:cysteine proteinase [Epithele typhae]|uniref:cysteine proteinase n=1 Tax=Epithele typhae TaxID=378194 RepID=UPI002007963A|nr:cysteine proteinase [Epithele typhae]KAH9914909.1 cysteine proteinase [Epithele typhae]
MNFGRKWIFGTSQPPATPLPVVVPQEPIISAADAKLFGLENFGSTCYANSVLQALYFCGPFRDLLLQFPDPSVPDVPHLPVLSPPPVQPPPPPPTISGRKRPTRTASVSDAPSLHPNAPPPIPIPQHPPSLLSALRSIFLHISRNPTDKGTVAPRAFIDKVQELNETFRPGQHQDAHEFLNFLLNQIVEEMEAAVKKAGLGEKSKEDLSTSIATLSTQPPSSTTTAQMHDATLVHRLFEGVLTSETRCLTCETVSARDESFLDLSIDIEQNSSVTACLRQFSASEMLCQKNKFFCDSCCDLQEAEKRMKIKKLPNILALHLKRFKYQEDAGRYVKLAYRVAFPLELRLFNTVDDAEDPDRLYELFAIVIHIGTGPHHGHYVAIIKSRGTWMLFDDDTVSTIKESEISKYFGDSNSGSAYVLYYQAADLNLSALGLKVPTPAPASATITEPGSTPGRPLATGEPSDQGHVPNSPSPAAPPGLVEETAQSDTSDSPRLRSPTLKAQVPLSVDIPPPSTNGPSSPSQSQPQPQSKGLMKTLRSKGSLRASNWTSDSRRSGADLVPPLPSSPVAKRPRTAQSELSQTDATSSATPSIPSSPVPSKGYVFPHHGNGSVPSTPLSDRAPEKKPSSWFKRKSSSRQDALAALPQSPSTPRLGRRGSEAAIQMAPPMASTSSSEPPLSPMGSGSHTKSATSSRDKEKRNSHTRRPSTAGPTMSSSRPLSGISSPPPLPTLPGSPASPMPNGTAAEHARFVKGTSRDASPFPASNPLPEHDSTASLHASRGLSSQPPSQAPSESHYSTSSTPSRSPQPQTRQLPPLPPHAHHTLSYGGGSGGGIGDTPVVPHNHSGGNGLAHGSGSSTSNQWKRATRKLSFTAPMLVFGRKDREKDRERREIPSSFTR